MPKSLAVKLDLRGDADYRLTVPARRKYVVAGADAVYGITATALTGFSGNTDISVSGLPSGASAAIGDETLGANESTTVTVETEGVSPGTYDFTIDGVSSDAGDYDWLTVDNADRLYDWASYCGIPGGIPNRTTIYTTLSSGATPSQINSAVAACPSDQVVLLGAGTFTVSSAILFNAGKSGVTLRGSGPGVTI